MKFVYSGEELTITNPELIKEWDYQANSPVTPDMLTKGNEDKYWWVCDRGHHYEASVIKRVHGQGCPYCKNKRVMKGFNDLVTTHPEVAAEWDYEENEKDPTTPDSPFEVTAGYNKKVHWKCKNGHTWMTSVNHRTCITGKGPTGCPRCAAISRNDILAREAARINNFAEKYPYFAKQWHPTKNGELKAEDVACKCNKKVWWKCDVCGNEWQATVNHRTRDAKTGLGCPRCNKTGSSFAEQILYYYVCKVFSDALIRDKETIGAELDIYISSLNTAVEFDGYVYHNNEKAIDREKRKNNLCKDHGVRLIRIRDERLLKYPDVETIEFKQYDYTQLNELIKELLSLIGVSDIDINVERDYYDAISRFKSYFLNHSLEYLHPELLNEWDYDKNKLLPSQVLCYGREKYYWKCAECGNVWQSDIGHRIGGRGCPECGRRRQTEKRSATIAAQNSIIEQRPDLVAEWHPTKNGNLTPDKISYGSTRKVWWKCPACGHEWEAAPASRKRNGCPECGKEKSRISRRANYAKKNNLLENYPELCEQWHPIKNGNKNPSDYAAGTDDKAWWLCPVCGYEWLANISSRALNGSGCPVCAGRAVMTGYNDLATKNPKVASEWHPVKNGAFTPQMVTANSNKRVWWQCKHGHEWEAVIRSRSRGNGCPFCSGRFPIKGKTDLVTLRPDIAKYWDYEKNGDKYPEDFKPSSGVRVWWKCDKCGYEWESRIADRNRADHICPNCNN